MKNLSSQFPFSKISRFTVILLIAFAIKVALSMAVPITIDEAYYYKWGKFLNLYYYDHPPMVGWILWGVLKISDATWWLRMPAILTSLILAYIWYRVLILCTEKKQHDSIQIALAIYVISPFSLINSVITTDIPAILFSGLSIALLALAIHKKAYRYTIISAIFLGLALLSKLLIITLLPALIVFLFFRRQYWRHAIVFCAALIPFVFALLWINYNGCWNNMMFILNRDGYTPWYKSFLTYLIFLFYISFPLGLWLIRKSQWLANTYFDKHFNTYSDIRFLLICTVGVSLIGYTGLSFFTEIGLHWILGFHVLWCALAGLVFERALLRKIFKWTAIWSTLHLALLAFLIVAPISFWNHIKLVKQPIFDLKTSEVYEAIKKPTEGRILMGDGYKASSFFSYFSGAVVPYFWVGSRHGRDMDVFADFRSYDGKNVSIFNSREPDIAPYLPFFNEVNIKKVFVRNVPFWLVEGDGFKYDVYKKQILSTIWKSYYHFPKWLPVGECSFGERYQLINN